MAPIMISKPGAPSCRLPDSSNSIITTARPGCRASSSPGWRACGARQGIERAMRLTDGLRMVAAYEAAKGALVLLAGFGLLTLIHNDAQYFAEQLVAHMHRIALCGIQMHVRNQLFNDAQYFAEQLVAHMHLNPAKGYPRIFIDAAARVTDAR